MIVKNKKGEQNYEKGKGIQSSENLNERFYFHFYYYYFSGNPQEYNFTRKRERELLKGYD